MALLFDLAKMDVSSAPGTGSTIALGAATTINGITFLTFGQAGATNGQVVDYAILDVNGVETGTATYSSAGPSLTGRTPTTSSNSNAAINASSASTVSISARSATLGDASLFKTGTVNEARLGSGGGTSAKALFGDSSWKTLAAIAQSGSASDLVAGLVAPALLGSGTPDFSKILRGDSAWVTNGRVLLGQYTASNSATLQDTTIFTTYGSYFPNFEIVYDNIVNQTTNRPLVLEVYSGGAFQTSGYQGYSIGTSATGYAPTTWVPLTANGAAAFPLNGYSGTARCYNPTGGGVVNWTNQSTGVVATVAHVQSGGGAWLTAAAIAGFRMRFDSGNIVSGIVRVYGIA